jgi:AraC-like DNA-binding protein
MKRALVSQHITLPPIRENLGLICTAVGFEYGSSTLPASEGPRTTTDWLLSYTVNGSFNLRLHDEREFRIEKGTIVVLPPDTEYEINREETQKLSLHYISFRGRSLDERKVCTAIDELVPVTEVGLNFEVLELFQQLLETGKSTNEGAQRELGASIVLLVAKLVNCKHAHQTRESQSTIIDQARILMRTHLNEHITIEMIAQELSVPVSTLRRVFTKSLGVSPYQYFLQSKIDYAKRELLRHNYPQRTIAEQLGFADQYHFSRVFKSVTGLRPQQWRKEHLNG